MQPKSRSKKVKLLGRLFDHVQHRQIKDFCDLTLGLADGNSFIPVAHTLQSSANKENRINEAKEGLDKRTLAYRRRQNAVSKKPDMVIVMLKRALEAGISAPYLLCDSWFTNAPLIERLKELNIHIIGMVKPLKQKYEYKDELYTLHQLLSFITKNGKDIEGSIVAKIPNLDTYVKIVFVRNRNKRSEFISILSTDIYLRDKEIVRIYAKRFLIESNYYCVKHYFKFTSECKVCNYDTCYVFSTISYLRMLIFELLSRSSTDERSYGNLFYEVKESLEDMTFATSLQTLLTLSNDFVEELIKHGFI